MKDDWQRGEGRVQNHSADHWRVGWPIYYAADLIDTATATFHGLTSVETAAVLATFDIIRWLPDPRACADADHIQKHITEPRTRGDLVAPVDLEDNLLQLGGHIDIRQLNGWPGYGFYRVKTFKRSGEAWGWRAIFCIIESHDHLQHWVRPHQHTRPGWQQRVQVVLVMRSGPFTYTTALARALFRQR